ncbi:hypothetical protein BG005_000444 [Podila minutissima]|nr:hypothetical protein BG005_000444 [Podila minutissima]
MLYGAAGTGVGSTIKGSVRRGGGKIRKQHMRHTAVGMTNEHKSSQLCSDCYRRIRLARQWQKKGNEIKFVSIHGAVECTNTDCPSFKKGWTIKPRDVNAAMNIAKAGASNLLSPNRDTLPPFSWKSRPFTKNSSAETLREFNTIQPITPPTSVTDAMEAPSGDRRLLY